MIPSYFRIEINFHQKELVDSAGCLLIKTFPKIFINGNILNILNFIILYIKLLITINGVVNTFGSNIYFAGSNILIANTFYWITASILMFFHSLKLQGFCSLPTHRQSSIAGFLLFLPGFHQTLTHQHTITLWLLRKNSRYMFFPSFFLC